MISLWMLLLLLVSGVRRGLGFSLPSACCRQRKPLAILYRFGSTPRSAGVHRQIYSYLGTMPSKDRDENEHEHGYGLSWLSGKDSKGNSYRLAYRRVLAAPNVDDGSGRSNEIDDPHQSRTAVLFCNGFRSAMTGGTKAVALENHCRQKGWEFCSFDYRGHGLSSGRNFEDCTLTYWIRDASDILDRVLLLSEEGHRNNRKRVILVGSSMGAWISIHLALRYNRRTSHNNNKTEYKCPEKTEELPIGGILGIASGPDFLQDFYSSSTVEQQTKWKANGVAHLPSKYGDPYPIPWSLVEDAARNWGILPSTNTIPSIEPSPSASVLELATQLSVRCPVRLLHGKCDEDVSWKKSEELSKLLKGSKTAVPESSSSSSNNDDSKKSKNHATDNNDVVLTLIEDGDHRLSRPQDIELLLETLDDMVMNL
jgi:pimeloyl-ACP methyl ester carboxylesterase